LAVFKYLNKSKILLTQNEETNESVRKFCFPK